MFFTIKNKRFLLQIKTLPALLLLLVLFLRFLQLLLWNRPILQFQLKTSSYQFCSKKKHGTDVRVCMCACVRVRARAYSSKYWNVIINTSVLYIFLIFDHNNNWCLFKKKLLKCNIDIILIRLLIF